MHKVNYSFYLYHTPASDKTSGKNFSRDAASEAVPDPYLMTQNLLEPLITSKTRFKLFNFSTYFYK